jgi:hypothetical protein
MRDLLDSAYLEQSKLSLRVKDSVIYGVRLLLEVSSCCS